MIRLNLKTFSSLLNKPSKNFVKSGFAAKLTDRYLHQLPKATSMGIEMF